MASTYTTGFSFEKIATGEQSGTWGTTSNHNWDIVDRLASYKAVAITTNADAHTLTVREASPGSGTENLQDGMYRAIKFTGALDSNCTVTIAPNSAPAWFIVENATTDSGSSGPYSLILSQGSGANVTVQNGKNVLVYCDGAGGGAAVVDALADLQIGTLEVTGAAAIDGAATLGSTLGVTGAITASGGVAATGNVTATGTVEPAGDTSASDNAAIGYTAAEGIIITGQGSTSDVTVKNDADATVFSIPTGTDDVLFPDDAKAMWGDGSDLKLYHDGTNSYVDNVTGAIYIRTNNTENAILAQANAAVTLYYDASAKFATTTVGATVTGTLIATTSTAGSQTGSVTLDFAANQNFVLTFTGNVTLANPSTEQVGQSGIICCIQDGTGSRTLSLGTDYETAGGAGITLSTAANSVDIIPYFVKASGSIQLGAVQLAFS
jgi:hypothetical protein